MKEPRYDVILHVLTHPQPVRPLLAYELRGPLVQLLGSGTTDPTWQASPRLLAEAIDQAVSEPPSSAHALVVEYRGFDLVGTCRCGEVLGRARPGTPLDALAVPWERHTAALAAAARTSA
ncbi:hypothetical protein [Streptomyces sp. S.PB5]|uniref:hypothetical protein n=1 Tax=Streptomyces sp. S.PB5 TaxID=3020844 RepID=UPI0025B1EF0B|nr:hypothetical protein [Streptomyces sp. S.PB5]MDN3021564.1 hypothetical protein [Streptomyces sp. S.PB5]